jgi:hypothetical protein
MRKMTSPYTYIYIYICIYTYVHIRVNVKSDESLMLSLSMAEEVLCQLKDQDSHNRIDEILILSGIEMHLHIFIYGCIYIYICQ